MQTLSVEANASSVPVMSRLADILDDAVRPDDIGTLCETDGLNPSSTFFEQAFPDCDISSVRLEDLGTLGELVIKIDQLGEKGRRLFCEMGARQASDDSDTYEPTIGEANGHVPILLLEARLDVERASGVDF